MLCGKVSVKARLPLLLLVVLSNALAGLAAWGCDPNNPPPGTPTGPDNAFEISLAYSSEKQPWIEPLAAQFNSEKHSLPGDKRAIFVNAFVADSATAGSQIARRTLQPTVWSPSTSLWGSVLNSEAGTEMAGSGAGEADPLLLTPVVLAMWKPLAAALGWPQKLIGLRDIADLSTNPKGWGAVGHAEWAGFKFAHASPEASSTGLSIVVAEFYAGAGKTSGLTQDDINDPRVRDFVKSVEQTNTYDSATLTVLEDNMRKGGMSYVSAVALEEQTVLDLNKSGLSTPLVAIYPKEGTFVHDNPYIVLRAPWVTDDQRRAAALFKDFLLQPVNQEKAVTLGFRPATTQVSWRAEPFTQANGVDPDQPSTTLQAPQPKVLLEVRKAWSGLRP